ncbi:MAG TPA: hypothetical protein VHM90_08640 [Phycisphaerae bacterium]|jgi:hypothetical protein|nr:hypothetical protein [Phycisphaerae bacterium]
MRRIILRAIAVIIMGILLSLPAAFYAAPHYRSGRNDWFGMDLGGIWQVHVNRPNPSPPFSGLSATARVGSYSRIEVAGGKPTPRDLFHLPYYQRGGLITAWYLPWWLFILPWSAVTVLVYWMTRKRGPVKAFPVEISGQTVPNAPHQP